MLYGAIVIFKGFYVRASEMSSGLMNIPIRLMDSNLNFVHCLKLMERTRNVDILTLECDLDFVGSNPIIALCTFSHNSNHLCQVFLFFFQRLKRYGADNLIGIKGHFYCYFLLPNRGPLASSLLCNELYCSLLFCLQLNCPLFGSADRWTDTQTKAITITNTMLSFLK
jgi:hypothetical protein